MTDGPGESERPTPPHVGSTWSVDWRGAAAVVVLGVIGLIAWRSFDGGSSDSSDSETSERTAATTVAAEPTVAPTTVRRTTTTSSTSTTTSTTVAPGPRVDIVGEIKPCRFGDECLVASFTVVGFDDDPDRYECIYPNSRSEFGFNDDGKDDACFSGDEGDTIAIDVDGVVSNTISAENLDGDRPNDDAAADADGE